jgi:YD repeat-containing protein
LGTEQRRAAEITEAHASTSTTAHLDPLGRPIASVAHNRVGGADALYFTRIELDVEGNTLAVIDDAGRAVMTYGYDLVGRRLFQRSMDSGDRWILSNTSDRPIRTWDSRGHMFAYEYDILQRPLAMRVSGGGDGASPLNHEFERIVYGEGESGDKARNLRGQIAHHYDTAGRLSNARFDFKGNPLESARRFAVDYKTTPDWSVPDPDAQLETEAHTQQLSFDALNRITNSTTSDGSITTRTYNADGLLETVVVRQNNEDLPIVEAIGYNEKGQRLAITYGNGVTTGYT